MFSIDTGTGFAGTVVINAAWGPGENVVQGMVNPDEYRTFKPLLDDPEGAPSLPMGLCHRGPLRRAHGHGMGAGRGCSCCRPGPRPSSLAGRREA